MNLLWTVRSTARIAASLPLAIVSTGCDVDTGGGASGRTGVTYRDSVGVQIVENHTPEWRGSGSQ